MLLRMTYITYRRFKGKGIDGQFNLPYGTTCTEAGGYLYAPDGRRICAVTSENGWEHFRPDTAEGERRQLMLDKLYKYYSAGGKARGDMSDFAPEKWPGKQNTYWKNLLRTMPTDSMERFCRTRGLDV